MSTQDGTPTAKKGGIPRVALPEDARMATLAVREGLERARLRQENRRLLALTQAHNEQLERRVAARTASARASSALSPLISRCSSVPSRPSAAASSNTAPR
mgnify:CR=1 FL=1